MLNFDDRTNITAKKDLPFSEARLKELRDSDGRLVVELIQE